MSGNYEDFLQTDASINPGTSGGPLVNLDGEVVGINSMIAGIGTGIGFAVPSSMARPIAEQLIATGKVRRPYLGILMQDVTPELQQGLGKGAPARGALVGEIQPDSPAGKAGLRPGDVVTKIDGAAVDGSRAVQRQVLAKGIGHEVTVTVWRDGREQTIRVRTAELPEERAVKRVGGTDDPRRGLGLALRELTPVLGGPPRPPEGHSRRAGRPGG